MSNDAQFPEAYYDDVINRRLEFDEFGVKDEFWIELTYKQDCNTWAPKGEIPIDLEIIAKNGKKIFRNLTPWERAYIEGGPFVLAREARIQDPIGGDFYYVTETYVCEPTRAFDKFYTAQIAMFQIEDDALSATSLIIRSGAGLSLNTMYFKIAVAEAAKYSLGDRIRLTAIGLNQGSFTITTVTPGRIAEIDYTTGRIDLDGIVLQNNYGGNVTWSDMVGHVINGQWYGENPFMTRDSVTTPEGVVDSVTIRERTSYHIGWPQTVPDKQRIKDRYGIGTNKIDKESDPNIAQWKDWVRNSAWIAIEPGLVNPLDGFTNVYKMVVRERIAR